MERNQRAGMAGTQFLGAVGVILLAAFAFYYYANNYAEQSKRALTIRRLAALELALQKYCVDCGGRLPTAQQGLAALVSPPARQPIPSGWNGPYLTDPQAVRDGWGLPFKYVCPGQPVAVGSSISRPFDLASYGRDGAEGGKGLDRDVCNWDRSSMVSL